MTLNYVDLWNSYFRAIFRGVAPSDKIISFNAFEKIWCVNFRDPGVWSPDFWRPVSRIPFLGVPIFKVPILVLDNALIYLFNRHWLFHGNYHEGLIFLYISVLKAKVKQHQDASLFGSNSYEFFLLEYIFLSLTKILGKRVLSSQWLK